MYFEQEKGEEIVDIIRKSLWTLTPYIFKGFSLSLPAIFSLFYLDIAMITFAALGWLVFVLTYVFYAWFIWYYDVYILTTYRVIEIHQRSLFEKEVNEIMLAQVQDVSYSMDGLGSAILGFGSVRVYSSGTLSIGLESIPSPIETKKIIEELKEESV